MFIVQLPNGPVLGLRVCRPAGTIIMCPEAWSWSGAVSVLPQTFQVEKSRGVPGYIRPGKAIFVEKNDMGWGRGRGKGKAT